MSLQSLTTIKRAPLAVILGEIGSENKQASSSAGLSLVDKAKSYGISVKDYLDLAVDVRASEGEDKGKYLKNANERMSGYEAALADLNLPVQNNFKQGIVLQAAADSFSARPGSRALFPEVIDSMMQWSTKQDQFESTEGLVSQTRTVTGNEVITQAIFDDQGQLNTSPIAELANIPVQTITSSDRSVKFFKHGSAIRTSYEFERRVSLDVLTPYANRVARNLELSKVAQATRLLIEGDGVHSAATPFAASALKNWDITGSKSLKDNYVGLADFLARRAKAGNPVDTIIGNYDMWLELFLMFLPTKTTNSDAAELQGRGMPRVGLQLDFLQGVNFKISSSMPAGQLMCYSVGDTLEELIENGSVLSESETAIKNQSITYIKTMNMGYRLVYGDTRTLLDLTA